MSPSVPLPFVIPSPDIQLKAGGDVVAWRKHPHLPRNTVDAAASLESRAELLTKRLISEGEVVGGGEVVECRTLVTMNDGGMLVNKSATLSDC